MKVKRTLCTGRFRPVHFLHPIRCLAAGIALAAASSPAFAANVPLAAASTAIAVAPGEAITDFYRAREARPLWLSSPEAAEELVRLLGTANLDGLDRDRYRVRQLQRALNAARGGDYRAVQRAEQMLSEAFVAYARDLRNAPSLGIYYVDRELVPRAPAPRHLLEAAAAAPSLPQFVARMGWMNPLYGQLRQALANRSYSSESQRRTIQLNLERARTLPAGNHRYVVVNSAAQRLYMYENGSVVGSMRVVVGKPHQQTPMMTAFIRYVSLNPYWNVPPDLAAERIAPNVVKSGLPYLKSRGYQVLSDWTEKAKLIDPATIDWKAVAEGKREVRLRQLPGPGNAMGKMKFMFPNDEGVYLHDTPEDQLFSEASRLFSGGCVRLEDAPRLAEWLFGNPVRVPRGGKPEQDVPLPAPVPVYLTYMTVLPSGSQLAFYEDIYGRDRARLAELSAGGRHASR